MTVKEYADKYGLTEKQTYYRIKFKYISAERAPTGWDLADIPPPPLKRRQRELRKLDVLSEYELSILWFSATICDDHVIIRDTDKYFSDIIYKKLGGWKYQNNKNGYILKTFNNIAIDLRAIGFTGRMDAERMPPPVSDESAMARALIETHHYLKWVRQKERHTHNIYYAPALVIFGGVRIMEAVNAAIASAIGQPRRTLCRLSNGKSYSITYVAREQLQRIYTAYAKDEYYQSWWDDVYYPHITAPKKSEKEYKIMRNKNDTL